MGTGGRTALWGGWRAGALEPRRINRAGGMLPRTDLVAAPTTKLFQVDRYQEMRRGARRVHVN